MAACGSLVERALSRALKCDRHAPQGSQRVLVVRSSLNGRHESRHLGSTGTGQRRHQWYRGIGNLGRLILLHFESLTTFLSTSVANSNLRLRVVPHGFETRQVVARRNSQTERHQTERQLMLWVEFSMREGGMNRWNVLGLIGHSVKPCRSSS